MLSALVVVKVTTSLNIPHRPKFEANVVKIDVRRLYCVVIDGIRLIGFNGMSRDCKMH